MDNGNWHQKKKVKIYSFRFLLETSDISTQVKEIHNSTRPRLINYIKKNIELDNNTIGLNVKRITK